MHAEYDPISLFERNSCFRVNIRTFQKIDFFQKKEHLLKKEKYFGEDGDRTCAFPTAKLTLYQLRHEGKGFFSDQIPKLKRLK